MRVDLLDLLKSLRGLFLVDHALTLTVLNAAQVLIMSLLLLFALGTLFFELKLEELLLLLKDGLVFLPALSSILQNFFS